MPGAFRAAEVILALLQLAPIIVLSVSSFRMRDSFVPPVSSSASPKAKGRGINATLGTTVRVTPSSFPGEEPGPLQLPG